MSCTWKVHKKPPAMNTSCIFFTYPLKTLNINCTKWLIAKPYSFSQWSLKTEYHNSLAPGRDQLDPNCGGIESKSIILCMTLDLKKLSYHSYPLSLSSPLGRRAFEIRILWCCYLKTGEYNEFVVLLTNKITSSKIWLLIGLGVEG